MTIRTLAVGLLVMMATACGGAAYQTLTLTNKSPRPIEQLYVFETGKDRGASRGALAPEASTTVKMKARSVDVYAISQKIIIDEHTRETPEASVTVELSGPLTVIFHDEGATVPGVEARDAREATFRVTEAPAASGSGDDGDPDASPAPDGMDSDGGDAPTP